MRRDQQAPDPGGLQKQRFGLARVGYQMPGLRWAFALTPCVFIPKSSLNEQPPFEIRSHGRRESVRRPSHTAVLKGTANTRQLFLTFVLTQAGWVVPLLTGGAENHSATACRGAPLSSAENNLGQQPKDLKCHSFVKP